MFFQLPIRLVPVRARKYPNRPSKTPGTSLRDRQDQATSGQIGDGWAFNQLFHFSSWASLCLPSVRLRQEVLKVSTDYSIHAFQRIHIHPCISIYPSIEIGVKTIFEIARIPQLSLFSRKCRHVFINQCPSLHFHVFSGNHSINPSS